MYEVITHILLMQGQMMGGQHPDSKTRGEGGVQEVTDQVLVLK